MMICPLPFVHMNIKPDKTTTSCWRCLENHGDYTKHSLMDIWQSSSWNEFRQQHKDGQQPKGCRSCWETEKNGIKSTRQTALEEYSQHYENPVIKEVEIRFGNLCNLQCRHCSPKYSSQWMKQIKLNKDLLTEMEKFDDSSTKLSITELPDNIIKEFKTIAPTLKRIKITGGEPLMHPKHQDLLESLRGHEENIWLEYNTNLHVIDGVIDYWKKYKKVTCRVSVDADSSTFDYVRTNGKYQTLINNWLAIESALQDKIEKNKFDLHATCTVNVLNVFNIPKIMQEFANLGSRFHVSFVQYPKMMNIKNLPDWQKQQLIDKLSNIEIEYDHWRYDDLYYFEWVEMQNATNLNKVIDWLKQPADIDYSDQFVAWMRIQDKINKTCLFDYYKDFDYLKEKYYA